MSKDKDKIEIGLELEFSNVITHGWVSLPTRNNQNVQKILTPWKTKLEKDKSTDKKNTISIFEPTAEDIKKIGYTKPWLLRVEYHKYDQKTKNEYNLTWDITIDISVIEVIIQKSLFQCYTFFKKDLQRHIYDFAKEVGLDINTHDNYLSMTHINIDFRSGFDKNFRSVLYFILAQEEKHETDKKEIGYIKPHDTVLLNAHYIQEIISKENWEKKKEEVAKILKETEVKYKVIEDFMTINKKELEDFFSPLEICKGVRENIISSPWHYYAVNIEHLLEKNEAYQRVEVRRNIGMENLYDTLQYVAEVLDEVVKSSGISSDTMDFV
jgi:hypothetical protein